MDILKKKKKKNDALRFYWSRTIFDLAFWSIFILLVGVQLSSFVVVSFFLTSLRKDYFLRRRLQRYRFSMAEIAVLLLLDIRLPASSQIALGMMDG